MPPSPRPRLIRLVPLLLGLLLAAAPAPPAAAQFVAGPWLEHTDAAIQEHRTTPLRVLVLDADGKLAPHAKLHLEQTRHAFTLGFVTPNAFPDIYDPDAPGWRIFNAVALDRLTAWRDLQPEPVGQTPLRATPLDAAIAQARAHRLDLHWGPLLSADPFHLPEWAVPLRGPALHDAALGHLRRVLTQYGPALTELDLADQTLDHDRFSPASLRRLSQELAFAAPHLTPRLRFDQALAGGANFDAARAIDLATANQLALSAWSVTHRFSPRPLEHELLHAALDRLTRLRQPVLVSALEAPGQHAVESSANLETLLRTLFAHPRVQGVVFANPTSELARSPDHALFLPDGSPAGPMRTADHLFRNLWWTDATAETNELGQAAFRAFFGEHQITATLQDGSTLTLPLRLTPQHDPDTPLVLAPLKPEP
ncbi:MAG: hypothetical protein AAGG38_14410 [Planctomycetota bacterium]